MFGKIKKILFTRKFLIIVLASLALVGWVFAIFFGVRMKEAEKLSSVNCLEKLGKINSYGTLLDQSNKLARQEKGLDGLEVSVRALKNGSVLAEWENVVWGGNREKDLEAYFDTIIDSIIFFSK